MPSKKAKEQSLKTTTGSMPLLQFVGKLPYVTEDHLSANIKKLCAYMAQLEEEEVERDKDYEKNLIRSIKYLLDIFIQSAREAIEFYSMRFNARQHELASEISRQLIESELLWRLVDEDGVLSGEEDDTALNEIVGYVDSVSDRISQIVSLAVGPGNLNQDEPKKPSMLVLHDVNGSSYLADHLTMNLEELLKYKKMSNQGNFERSEDYERPQIRDVKYLLSAYLRGARSSIGYCRGFFDASEHDIAADILRRLIETELLWRYVDDEGLLSSEYDDSSLTEMTAHVESISAAIEKLTSASL